MTIDPQKLQSLLGTVVNEIGAAANAALVLVGDRLGLYKALASSGPCSPAKLAQQTSTAERYVREWCCAQATSGFITYDAAHQTFSLSDEQAAVFADDASTVNMTGGFYALSAIFADEPKLTQAFKTGKGIGWGDHCNCLFCGTERFFRPGYKGHLVSEWLPALDGVVPKLTHGARVADVGCGHGASTIIMADAFPKSQFIGIDFHEPSITRAREAGANRNNLSFSSGHAQEFAGEGFDLITIFDALHDMGDPVGAARHARKCLKDDGTLMLVEPAAGDSLSENMNVVSRVYYAFSTNVCVPASLNQEVGAALGAQAGEKQLTHVLKEAGFTRVRKAVSAPFNMVIEARP